MSRRAIAAVVVLTSLSALLLAGCAAASAKSSGPNTPEPPVSTFALTCQPPTDTVLTWLRVSSHADQGSSLDASQVSMVDVGTGTTAGSDWWIVAAPGSTFGKPSTWLTNAPARTSDAYAYWIPLYSDTSSDPWNTNTNWTGDRLARGKQAQTKAISCLGG